jgi:hypothetical protein
VAEEYKARMRERAAALLERVEGIHAGGSGDISMSDLFSLLGVDPTGPLQDQLAGRGPIELTFGSDGKGSFRNTGPALVAPVGPAKLNVPAEIGGKATWQARSLALEFDTNRAPVAKALILELRVQRLELSEHHAAVRFPGGTFDQEMKF